MTELLMGNEAVALGALAAGVFLVSGYPGTPSTEVLETVAKRNPGGVHVEWSVNEKAAMGVAAGAVYSGARAMVTMKQVGLNVASDPLMCVNYIGIRGGLVVYVADDPGPISSQTEQDTRHFGKYARIPVLDCPSPEEAYILAQEAFALSEELGTPVILRSTTRICHSCASVDVAEPMPPKPAPGFEKSSRWVIFPKLAYESKNKLFSREESLSRRFSELEHNRLEGTGLIGIACGGVSWQYVREAIAGREELFTVLRVATPYPFPDQLAKRFMSMTDRVLAVEELDPVIEDALRLLPGGEKVLGKRTGSVPAAGELSAVLVAQALEKEFSVPSPFNAGKSEDAPPCPIRPPVLCAGCPHRASFYAVKKAMKGKKAVFCGDIGCYTLGNAAPLDMVDTCLCMGAGITVAQGIYHADGATCFSFVGDSTFFASGITGVINAVYNKAELVLVVLDNSATAMTGHQPHPGLGVTAMGEPTVKADIEAVLRGIGVTSVRVCDPLDHAAAVKCVSDAAAESGVRAIIFKSPCVVVTKPKSPLAVDAARCLGCKRCIGELGCPGMSFRDGAAVIDATLCVGCGLCANLCPAGCIGEVVK